jgi:hypothetical protein
MWQMLEALAPTIAYDSAVMCKDSSVPTEQICKITLPALVMTGSDSPIFMHTTAQILSKAIPKSQLLILDKQMYDVKADVFAPVLAEFFSDSNE